ncbi:MAG: hypothetical protein J6O04_10600 [Selenomonadaceae bacterium]|nr:hypothetical protein [Selenomonadaceae bacterium]
MAISLLDSWSNLQVDAESGDTKIHYGDSLTNNTLGDITITPKNFASGVSIGGPGGGSTTLIHVGIYAGSKDVYAFASSESSASGTTSDGSFKLVAYASGEAGGTIGANNPAITTTLSSIYLTLMSGSGKTLNIASTSILGLTGSSGDDSVILSGVAGLTSQTFDFSQGGTDVIYFQNAATQKLTSLKQSSGNLSLVSSSDGSTKTAGVVLNGNMGTVTLEGSAAANSFKITSGGNDAIKLGSAFGTVSVVAAAGSTIASLDLTALESGKFTTSGSIASITAGTISGGSGIFGFTGTGASKIKLGLVSGGKVTIDSGKTSASVATIGSITGGEVAVLGSGYDSLNASITGGKLVLNKILTLGAGTKIANAEMKVAANSIGGSAGQTYMAGVVAAGTSFAFEGTGADTISLSTLGDNATVSVKGGADLLSVASFGAGAQVNIQANDTYLTLASGSSFGSLLLNNDSIVTAQDTAVLAGSVTGGSTIVGSTGDDQFNLTLNNSEKVTLTGGSGDDTYKLNLASGSSGAVITDFGWADASGKAADSTRGADVVIITDTSAQTLAQYKLAGTGVLFGDSNVTATVASGADVYAKLGVTATSAKLYKITDKGASLFDSSQPQEVDAETVAGGTYFDASNTAHAYVDAASGANTVNGFATYDGTNDNVASILNGNNVTVDNAQLSTGTDGSVVLQDAESVNSIKLTNVTPGNIIKMGTSATDTQAVYLASSGTNAMNADQLNVLNKNKGVILGQGTGTKIDLGQTKAGTINADDGMYKNIGGILGSTAGGSLLNAGSGSVNLVSQADGDTMDGGTGSVANVLTASGNKTTFALHEGIGKDTISGFTFGPDTVTADVVDFGSGIALSTDNVTLGSGKLLLGSGSDSYEIKAASGADQAVVRYSGGGSNGGAILADLSSGGSADLNYVNGVNIVMGQGEKTTLSVGSGDTVAAERSGEPSGIGWNSMILTNEVGTIDGTKSSMTAFNGEGGYSQTVKASTVVGAATPVWLCGGLQEGFSDLGNDTLVASGNGNNVVYVGAKMGNDVIQGLTSGDTITFIDTKIGDYASAADAVTDIITVGKNGFTAAFTGGATIGGAFASSSDKITNLVFHFDTTEEGVANDYRWDGKSLVAITSTQTA